jgi:hypothetical protein
VSRTRDHSNIAIGDTGDWTQDLLHAKQTRYHCAISPNGCCSIRDSTLTIIQTQNHSNLKFTLFYQSKYHPKYLHQDIHSVPGPTFAETYSTWIIRNITHTVSTFKSYLLIQRLPKWYSTHTFSQSRRSIRCPADAQYKAKAKYQSTSKVQHTELLYIWYKGKCTRPFYCLQYNRVEICT